MVTWLTNWNGQFLFFVEKCLLDLQTEMGFVCCVMRKLFSVKGSDLVRVCDDGKDLGMGISCFGLTRTFLKNFFCFLLIAYWVECFQKSPLFFWFVISSIMPMKYNIWLYRRSLSVLCRCFDQIWFLIEKCRHTWGHSSKRSCFAWNTFVAIKHKRFDLGNLPSFHGLYFVVSVPAVSRACRAEKQSVQTILQTCCY